MTSLYIYILSYQQISPQEVGQSQSRAKRDESTSFLGNHLPSTEARDIPRITLTLPNGSTPVLQNNEMSETVSVRCPSSAHFHIRLTMIDGKKHR